MNNSTFVAITLLFVTNVLMFWRCDILSRRIDTVHKRITLTNRMNGLKNGAWDDDSPPPRPDRKQP